MEVTLDEAKTYLRVASNDEDELITSIISSATRLVQDITRLSDDDWADENSAVIRIAILYTIAYLYEHREEADHSQLNLTLRALLFGVREEGF
jgi:uncharacterized phage protein (predicted DNA packaging)